ncbi:replication factor A1, partial [Pancytospora epiphaga]
PAVVIKRSRETSENVKKGKTTNGSVLVDIKDINPFQEHWMVKGRITAKTEIKTFTSAKGQGKLFSFELVDKTAQVKCVVFSENVDAFFPLVELNKVITINNATIRMANKKYSLGNLDYEIQLDKGTVIQEVNDDSVPQYNFKFMKIKDLAVGPSPVDVIAVIRQVYPVGTVTTKGTGEEIIKRDLYVVDETGGCRLTLWGPTGDREYEPDNSICLKGVRVGEYNGISLSSMRSTQVILNCDIPEAVEIMAWYHSGGKNVSTDKPTANPGQRQFLGSMKDTELEYATIQGSILLIKEGSLYYEACPGDGCNKKVSAEDDGSYRCGKCNYSYPNCNYRYMLSPLIGDFTGQEWISMFDEVGRSFFGMTAQQLKEMGEEDPRSLQNLLRSIVSKEFTMRVRIKNDVYNGEPKKRLTCMTCAPLDFGAEAHKMIAAIEQVQ